MGGPGSQEDAGAYGDACWQLPDSQASATDGAGKPPLSKPAARAPLRQQGGSGPQAGSGGGALAAATAEARRASNLNGRSGDSAKGLGLRAPSQLEKRGSGSLYRKRSSSAGLDSALWRPAKRGGSGGSVRSSGGGGNGGAPKAAGVAAASAMLQRRKSAAADTVAARTVVEVSFL